MLCDAMTSLPPASFRTIEETSARLRRGATSSEALARECLARIATEQPRINAFITVLAESAIGAARARDAELRAGRDRGPLHGIPIVHKDLFDTAGVRTTAGSRLFDSRTPSRDAIVVRNLADAGAIVLGKTNMNELAAGTSGRNVFFGDVRNPWNVERSPGGSSSGTAAAVAAGLCLAGTASDTGGSIRIPAACNGLVGLRPTFGRLSLEGVTLRSPSLDCVGPIARSVADCALLFHAMAGTTGRSIAPRKTFRIGIFADLPSVDPQVAQSFDACLRRLSGATLVELRAPALFHEDTLETAMDLMLYEFHDLLREEFRRAVEPARRFGPVVLANLERGSKISRQRYDECMRNAGTLSLAVQKLGEGVDALALPVLAAPTPALDSPPALFDAQRRLTHPLSLTGLPVIAVPCGTDASGMPLGLQLVGKRSGDEDLFALAATVALADLPEASR